MKTNRGGKHLTCGCVGKQAYDTKAEALKVIQHTRKRGDLRGKKGSRLDAYRCPRCACWHVGGSQNLA